MYFVIFITFCSAVFAIFAIWLWALVHCRGNTAMPWLHKEWWLLLIAVTPPFGALLYLYLHRHEPVSLDLPHAGPSRKNSVSDLLHSLRGSG